MAAITKAIVPQNMLPQQGNSGKIIVNRNKLDEIMQTPSNRMVVAPKKSVKDRLGQRVVREELLEIDECSGIKINYFFREIDFTNFFIIFQTQKRKTLEIRWKN